MEKFKTLDEALRETIGRILSSVEFVQDYVQLRFDGALLTAYTHPYLIERKKTIVWEDSGYRDSLCNLIGIEITDAHVAKDKVSILFQNGTSLNIPLEDKDYQGPEALMFHKDHETLTWVVSIPRAWFWIHHRLGRLNSFPRLRWHLSWSLRHIHRRSHWFAVW